MAAEAKRSKMMAAEAKHSMVMVASGDGGGGREKYCRWRKVMAAQAKLKLF